MIIFGRPTRLLRGRTSGWPKRCDHPTCHRAVDKTGLRVSQGTRRWAFCTVECLRGYIVLAYLPDVHMDEMVDTFGWLDR